METKTSDKFDKFMAALNELCLAHKVQVSVSGYDAVQIWNAKPGDEPIYANGIVDRTHLP